MRPIVLAAGAAFKGTFGPRQVTEAIARGVRRALPESTVLQCPISDGGDGLLDAVLGAESKSERVTVTGPLGAPVSATLGWINGDTAILESASAAGIALLQPDQLDPIHATTRGVGELIWEAVNRGAHTVIVGLGGSATVDGGTGAACGLGWTLRDGQGRPLPEGGGALVDLASFEGGWGITARVVALVDVTNPLVGAEGAAPVFGPQKGASPDDVARLSAGLEVLAGLMAARGRPALATIPGGGAAGGLGAGLAFFAGAELVRGAEWVLERVGFDAALARADLLITGEGTFDRTSLGGKASGEVLRRAQGAKKKVTVIAGKVDDLIGVHALSGEGRMLELEGIAALAERGAREAFGLPLPTA